MEYKCVENPADTLMVRQDEGNTVRFTIAEAGETPRLVYLGAADVSTLAKQLDRWSPPAAPSFEEARENARAAFNGECPPRGCAVDGFGRSQCPGGVCPEDAPKQTETLDDALNETEGESVGKHAKPVEEPKPEPVTFGDAMLPQPGTFDLERAYIRACELLKQTGRPFTHGAAIELARYLAGEEVRANVA